MPAAALSPEERIRYARHLALPDFGEAAQLRLKAASALVVGAGGLGCPALQYLAAAGVGRIGIVDGDTVALHNLQRQVLYRTDDVGLGKAETAARHLRALNPLVRVEAFPRHLEEAEADALVAGWDVVLDATDNFPTRYRINDACARRGVPHVHASIDRYTGQLAVFNAPLPDGSRGPDYRDLYPEPPAPGTVPDCAEGGVLGVLPGLLGTWQAAEALKLLSGTGRPLSGRLLLVDLRDGTTHTLRFARDPARPARPQPVSPELCSAAPSPMKTLTVHEFRALRERGEAHQLIDVREPFEAEIATLGGELIPLAEVVGAPERIARDRKVILHCQGGKRSANVIRVLEERYGYDNLYNLEGGTRAWPGEFDPSVPEY